MTTTEYVTDYARLLELLYDRETSVESINIISDNMAQVRYQTSLVSKPQLDSVNVVVAALTTSHARLRLYSIMEHLAQYGPLKCLYSDTDSVLLVQRESEIDPPCSPFLGDLKNEYPGKRIVSFISTGPKVYSLLFEDGTSVTKIRGFTLNFENSQRLNRDVLMRMVKESRNETVTVRNRRIVRRDGKLITKSEQKKFGMVYDKRIIGNPKTKNLYIGDSIVTYPYGYEFD